MPSGDLAAVECFNPLESGGWDEQLRLHPEASVFHTTAWARVLHATYGYRPCYLRLGSAGPVLPLMEVDSWLTGRRGVSLPFTDRCDPLGTDNESFRRLLEAATERGRARRWKYLHLCGGSRHLPQAEPATSFWEHQLDLSVGPDRLLAGFDGAVRRAIKRAEAENVDVGFATDEEAMAHYYRLHCLTRKRQGMPPQPLSFFLNIQRFLLATGAGWIALARHRDEPVAGAVYFVHDRQALYKFGASDETRQHLRANQAVMWKAIHRLTTDGCSTLDFGRTSLTNEGLRRYKLNFGTVERRLDYHRIDPANGDFLTSPDRASGWHNRLFQLAPTAALRLFGTVLYRHQG